jgi:hypothetical protein
MFGRAVSRLLNLIPIRAVLLAAAIGVPAMPFGLTQPVAAACPSGDPCESVRFEPASGRPGDEIAIIDPGDVLITKFGWEDTAYPCFYFLGPGQTVVTSKIEDADPVELPGPGYTWSFEVPPKPPGLYTVIGDCTSGAVSQYGDFTVLAAVPSTTMIDPASDPGPSTALPWAAFLVGCLTCYLALGRRRDRMH